VNHKRDGETTEHGSMTSSRRRAAEDSQIAISEIPADVKLLNRELSWLEFNRRVLTLATDDRTPLLERVKFLAIFGSNLDEFVMKRVGGLKQQVEAGVAARSFDGLSASEQLTLIREEIVRLQTEQATCFEEQLIPLLAEQGVEVVRYEDLTESERQYVDNWFRNDVFPLLTPLAVDPGHRFPFISNLSTSIGVLLKHPEHPEQLFARVKIPSTIPRWVPVSDQETDYSVRVVNLPDLVRFNLDELFPGMRIQDVMPFRLTRAAEQERDDEDNDDLMEAIEEELRQRRFAPAVRLEVWPDASPEILAVVLEELNLDPTDVYKRPGPLDYSGLMRVAELNRPELKYRPWTPITPPRLADTESDIFSIIRQGDLLVHHPYESFATSVERFLASAASDPRVLAIKQTLYRTSPDSPFVKELMRAAERGKQVACLVELRARFDEFANIQVAQRLEKAGVHVAYGVVGLKTHSKTSLVVRQDSDGLRCYSHIGTGNYNSKTARLYTDVGLLTCDPDITDDVVELFNYLTGRSLKRDYNQLLIAPVSMRRRFVELIEREMEIARSGGPARIIAKMNALQDVDIIETLYEASRAGVEIDLVVRGFCCLRPGVPGMSDNIRVISVVGRFLEHSRIFHFGAGMEDPVDGEWYLGSADWMYRNLNNRVEAVTPILARSARSKLHTILRASLLDHCNAWDMMPDGSYVQRMPPEEGDPESPQTLGTFETLMRETLVSTYGPADD